MKPPKIKHLDTGSIRWVEYINFTSETVGVDEGIVTNTKPPLQLRYRFKFDEIQFLDEGEK